jgi:hypothetical protein
MYIRIKLNYLIEAFNDDLENLKLSKNEDARCTVNLYCEAKENNLIKRIEIGPFLLNYNNTKHEISKNMDISCFFCSN